MEASSHEAVEEVVVWPVVRRRVEGGSEMADHGIEQENGAKRLFNELDKTSPGNDEFATSVQHLASHLRDHIALEENQVWPPLRLQLTDEELEELAHGVERSRSRAPTRPHPHTPPNAPVLKTLGAAAAMVDRARDALSGRNRKT
jgi:hemerythrin-like domain-containing protein